jgi:hypothetical protein
MTLHTLSAEDHDELLRLRAENIRLRTAMTSKLAIRVSKSRGVSVYGLGRYPVTLYRSQWDRLIEIIPQVKAFIDAHASELASKTEE